MRKGIRHSRFFNLVFGVILLIVSVSTTTYAQDITEEDFKEQQLVLKENPKDFGANWLHGAWYYNQAIPPHMETTKMGVVEYLKEGEPYEKKKEDLLKKSLTYFENAYALANAEQKNNLKDIFRRLYQELGVIPKAKTNQKQIDATLDAKLAEIVFKEID